MRATRRAWWSCVLAVASIAAAQGCIALRVTNDAIAPLRMQGSENGVRPREAKLNGAVWLVRGEWNLPNPESVYWRCNFASDTMELLSSDAEWNSCSSTPQRVEQLRHPVREGLVQAKSQRVWIEEERTKRVVAESPVRMKWIMNGGTDRARRWVIVYGTSVERHEYTGKPGLPLPSPTTYTFGPPKVLSMEAFSLPDLKPLGPEVLLADAVLSLPDVKTGSGFASYFSVWTAEGMPGVVVVGSLRELWLVSEDRLKGAKP